MQRNNGYMLYPNGISAVFVIMKAWEFQDQISSVRKQTNKKKKIRENKTESEEKFKPAQEHAII